MTANNLHAALRSIIDTSVRDSPNAEMLGDCQVRIYPSCSPRWGVTVSFDSDGKPNTGSGVDTSGDALSVARSMYRHMEACAPEFKNIPAQLETPKA